MTVLGLSILAICLVLVAMGLLIAELFLPTHGLLAAGAGLCALGAVAVLLSISVTAGLIGAIILLVVSPFAIYYGIKTYPQTPVGRRVLLAQPEIAPQDSDIRQLLGQTGKALTRLRPAGVVDINSHRVDCLTEGDIIEAGSSVTVVSVSNGRVVVRETQTTA